MVYYSAKLNKAEQNYSISQKELAALMKSLVHFHHYLYGMCFTICMDHAALWWLKIMKESEG